MMFEYSNFAVAIVLFLGMVGCCELGRQIARVLEKRDPEGAWQGIAVVDGAVFGLLGLIVAFTFSGAASRFDARRSLIVQEVNAIGTAYLRLDLLPADARLALRDRFRAYLDQRIELYQSFPDLTQVNRHVEASKSIEQQIWTLARSATANSQPATMLLLPALNEMFDIANARVLSTTMHPPLIIYLMLYGLALAAAMFAGYGMAKSKVRNWFHILSFSIVTASALYVIVDLEHPRLGFVKIGTFDSALDQLRKDFD
jgi:hypothetical protein